MFIILSMYAPSHKLYDVAQGSLHMFDIAETRDVKADIFQPLPLTKNEKMTIDNFI